MNTVAQRFLSRADVCQMMGRSSASLHGDMKRGVFPPPIKTAPNAARWPEREVASVQAAIIGGKSEDELRELVTQLVAARTAEQVPA